MNRAVLALVLCVSACGPSPTADVTAIDLLKIADGAERRPTGTPVAIVERLCGASPVAGLAVPAQSRVIYRLNFPARARLVAVPLLDGAPGATAEFRVGISDGRTYETLMTRMITADDCSAGDSAMTVDLSGYGGWQWSLFYRPDDRVWELILGVSADQGQPSGAVWGMPRIEADTRAARAFLARGR